MKIEDRVADAVGRDKWEAERDDETAIVDIGKLAGGCNTLRVTVKL